MAKHNDTIPIEVCILTVDHDIKGTVHVSKYTNTDMVEYAISTDAKVGLLRFGELMSGQFNKTGNNNDYWLLTSPMVDRVWYTAIQGDSTYNLTANHGIKPSLNLKSNVIITSGDGTRNNPFTLSVQ